MHLIFDFDGTLVDSFRSVVEKAILLADKFHLRKIENHEIENLRDLSSEEVLRFLKVRVYQIPKLIYEMRKHLSQEIPTLPPIKGMPEVIRKLHEAQFSLSILTSNSRENVTLWLDQHNLRTFFNFITIESHFFSKGHLLKKIIKKHQIDPSKAFYIGDETRDIEAANKNHIQSIAVTWGYNSEKILLKHQPSFIAKKPADIEKIIYQSC